MRDFQSYTEAGRRARRRWWLWLLPVVLIVLILGVGVFAGPVPIRALGYGSDPEAGGTETPQSSWIERMFVGQGPLSRGPLNMLVLGVDTRPDQQEMGSRTDTIMLVQVVPKTGDVRLLSVPRDLLVEVEPGRKDRINAAYNYGGIDETVDALESYAGVPIEHYATVDFQGFNEIIDAMGGVKVDVGHGVFPEKWHMGEGVQRLGGRKALFYARYRGTACGDLDRIDHQQRLLAALRKQALGWNTISRLPRIVKVTNENVDTNLGVLQAISLARALVINGKDGEMSTTELKGYPTYLPDGEQVLIPNTKANDAILQDFRNDAPKEHRSDRASHHGK